RDQGREVAVLRAGLVASGQEFVVLDRATWAVEASSRAQDWLASLAADREADRDALPSCLRDWIDCLRARLAADESLPVPMVQTWASDDGSSLATRYIAGDPQGDCDGLLLYRQDHHLTADDLAPLGLTRREAELLAAVAAGLTNEALAARFSISERTVEKHLSHVYMKLGISTRTAAVHLAFETARALHA
ncbi:MAG: helix-turn-helix transcriptional regulator, partial [Thermomicrobiales bacterium]